jgi:NAD(P)-dependent dehydrogenase (short-subunit alcohol dehydrogenase family)
VTGGLGGLGLIAASNLAINGASPLNSVSRRGRTSTVEALLQIYLLSQQERAATYLFRCDVSDGSAVSDLIYYSRQFGNTATKTGSLAKVLHASGVL